MWIMILKMLFRVVELEVLSGMIGLIFLVMFLKNLDVMWILWFFS